MNLHVHNEFKFFHFQLLSKAIVDLQTKFWLELSIGCNITSQLTRYPYENQCILLRLLFLQIEGM